MHGWTNERFVQAIPGVAGIMTGPDGRVGPGGAGPASRAASDPKKVQGMIVDSNKKFVGVRLSPEQRQSGCFLIANLVTIWVCQSGRDPVVNVFLAVVN